MSFQSPKRQTLTPTEAYPKAVAFCNYQERCQQEVRTKLFTLGLTEEEADEMIIRLTAENYLNEERYACAYVRGKHYLKKWGRNKIKIGLKASKISNYCMQKGFAEIDADDYWKHLLQVLEKRMRLEKEKKPMLRRQKLLQYMMSRGYEQDLSQLALQELENGA